MKLIASAILDAILTGAILVAVVVGILFLADTIAQSITGVMP